MNLNKLEYLIAINDEGNLSRAAEKLYVSQPALSKALATLEQGLGVTLMERQYTKMIPTTEGQLDIASLSLPNGLPEDLECIMTEPDSLVIVVPNTPEFDYINLKYTNTIPITALNGVNAIQCRPESAAYKVYTPEPAMHYEHFLCVRKGVEITPKMRRVLKVLWGWDG